MGGDFPIDYFGAQRLQPAESAFLIGLDEAGIPGDIGREDRSETAFCAS
jgi:hypothetical protein